jgi:hypothetical protein
MSSSVAMRQPTKLGHRAGLDGLRRLAVIAMLLYHGGVSWGHSWYFADSVDVLSPWAELGTIIALGDSITDGVGSANNVMTSDSASTAARSRLRTPRSRQRKASRAMSRSSVRPTPPG